MKLPVVVRRVRASKELIALFVTRPATNDPAMCWGYTMNLSLTAVDPNHVMRATDKVETGEAQGFVARHILPSHYNEMGLALPVTWEIQQRARREENREARVNALKPTGFHHDYFTVQAANRLLRTTGLDYDAYRMEQPRIAREHGLTAISVVPSLLLPAGEFDAAFKKSVDRLKNAMPKKE